MKTDAIPPRTSPVEDYRTSLVQLVHDTELDHMLTPFGVLIPVLPGRIPKRIEACDNLEWICGRGFTDESCRCGSCLDSSLFAYLPFYRRAFLLPDSPCSVPCHADRTQDRLAVCSASAPLRTICCRYGPISSEIPSSNVSDRCIRGDARIFRRQIGNRGCSDIRDMEVRRAT